MAAEILKVVPLALQGSSRVIGGQAAPLVSPSGGLTDSTETSGLAGAAVDRALDGYCAAFAARLSAVAGALVTAADSYTATEDSNSAELASVAPVKTV